MYTHTQERRHTTTHFITIKRLINSKAKSPPTVHVCRAFCTDAAQNEGALPLFLFNIY